MISETLLLPDQTHFRLIDLAKAVARRFPSEPNDSKGINCLSRKLLPQFGFDSEPQYLYRLKGLVATSSLTQTDREQLKLMLAELPEVSHFMSNEEIENFFDKYYKLPNRPQWEPEITSPADRKALQADYDKRVARHCEDYVSKVKDGTLRLLDKDLTFLSVQESTAYYLQSKAVVTKADAIKFMEVLGVNLGFQGPNCRRQKVKWTKEFTEEVKKYRDSHGTKAAALKCKVSTALIRKKCPQMSRDTASTRKDAAPKNAFGGLIKAATSYAPKKKSIKNNSL